VNCKNRDFTVVSHDFHNSIESVHKTAIINLLHYKMVVMEVCLT
jgi:hypothetical protein